MRLILASSSPRRREILALVGTPFEIVAPDFDECVIVDRPIEEETVAFARGKALSVAQRREGALIIGSDTMIGLEQEKFGKPRDLADARQMLRALSGKTHRIFTSVVILDPVESGLAHVEQVEVDMRFLSDRAIDGYLARGESLDKAGGYSIQGAGAALIAGIRGDYLAAVGMPLKAIVNYLSRRGLPLDVDIERLYREKSFLNWSLF